jgi:acetolactate synthase regulatory subunit
MSTTFCFSVHADATPATLPRVLEVFALRGLVPERCHADRAVDELVVDLQLAELTATEAAHLAERLGRIVGVLGVLWSERRRAA